MTIIQRKKFRRLIHQLNELISEIRKDAPDAQFYVENGENFYILSGPSHDDRHEQPARQDRSLALEHLIHADCGGW